jgi:hypothetical protein
MNRHIRLMAVNGSTTGRKYAPRNILDILWLLVMMTARAKESGNKKKKLPSMNRPELMKALSKAGSDTSVE